jgi:hypothetical protein
MDGFYILFKKKTSAWFTMDTLTLIGKTRCSLYNIEHSNGGLITFPGGVVQNNAGEVIELLE